MSCAPAALLLWAGGSKALDRQESILAVHKYDVLPDHVVEVVAAILPWLEIAVAARLILGLFVRFAGVARPLCSARASLRRSLRRRRADYRSTVAASAAAGPETA